jgi:hypothetical protein
MRSYAGSFIEAQCVDENEKSEPEGSLLLDRVVDGSEPVETGQRIITVITTTRTTTTTSRSAAAACRT